jgi:hypothetical protein
VGIPSIAETLVRKHILLPVLVAALLAVNATAARAGSFVLTLSDGLGATQTIIDGAPGDLTLNSIMFSGAVGSFNVTVAANVFIPGPTAPVQMNVSTMLVKSTSAGTLRAELSYQGLSPAALGLGPVVVGTGTAGATLNGVGSVAVQSYLDKNNGTSGGTSILNTTIPGGPVSGTSNPVALLGDFSVLSVLEFNFNSAGMMTGTSGVQVKNAAVPEPTTLLLLGPALVGLVGFRRARRSKTR